MAIRSTYGRSTRFYFSILTQEAGKLDWRHFCMTHSGLSWHPCISVTLAQHLTWAAAAAFSIAYLWL